MRAAVRFIAFLTRIDHDQRRSSQTATVEAARPGISAAGQATFDLALRMGGLFLAIILVAVVLFVIKPNSFNIDVGISVLRAMSSVAIMSLGLTLVIVVGEIDLSFGAMYGLGANVLAVLWIIHGFPVYLALVLALGAAAVLGALNGMLVTLLRIPSFIVTLGSYNLLYGVSLWMTHTSTFNPAYPPPGHEVPQGELDFFTGLTTSFGAHPISFEVVWMLALAVLVGLSAASFTVRLPPHGDRRQSGRGHARAPAGRQVQDPRLHAERRACGDRRHPRLFLHPNCPAEQRPLLHLSGLRRRDHRRREPDRWQGHSRSGPSCGALLLAELQQGLALLSARAARPATVPRRSNDRRGGPRPWA